MAYVYLIMVAPVYVRPSILGSIWTQILQWQKHVPVPNIINTRLIASVFYILDFRKFILTFQEPSATYNHRCPCIRSYIFVIAYQQRCLLVLLLMTFYERSRWVCSRSMPHWRVAFSPLSVILLLRHPNVKKYLEACFACPNVL